jgi:hypothetical protein
MEIRPAGAGDLGAVADLWVELLDMWKPLGPERS